MDNNHVIQSLWVGDQLSTMERLCISSFLENGHEFHLYLYGACQNVPSGTVVEDANAIMPQADIGKYNEMQTFSDVFRYHLLQRRAAWWVDLDLVCLRPFDFPDDYVFASEAGIFPPDSGRQYVNVCAFKAPHDSALLRIALERCNQQDTMHPKGDLFGGEVALGPEMMSTLSSELGLAQYIRPPSVFIPIPCSYIPQAFIDPTAKTDLSQSYACHMFQGHWSYHGVVRCDKNIAYPKDCLYERLKTRYLG